MLKRTVPTAIAILVGLLTLLGLWLDLPQLSTWLLRWASFLAAVALLLGVLNLLAVHLNRLLRGSGYSGVLVAAMVAVFLLALTDAVGTTSGSVDRVFALIQSPLEAALASLLAFFLLFAGVQLLRRQRTPGMVLFWATAVLMLVTSTLAASRFVPGDLGRLLLQVQQTVSDIVVTAGVRGILIGVALGAITLSVRILIGAERPYSK